MRMSNLRQPGSSSGFSKYFCTTHGGDERGWGREKRGGLGGVGARVGDQCAPGCEGTPQWRPTGP